MYTALALTTACLLAAPMLAHPGHGPHSPTEKINIAQTERVLVGWGEHAFESVPNWAQVPDGEHFGPTHGSVAVDKDGLIYVTLDNGEHGIIVYNAEGKVVNKIAPKAVGLHSLLYRDEDGTGYLYGALPGSKRVVKLTLEGEIVWEIGFPKESDKYPGPGRYRPTAVAVGPEGQIYIADGYGLSWIHMYDKDRNYVKSFGGGGQEDGKFRTCHGISLDTRGDEPRLLICDRENRRLQYFDLDGNFIKVSTTGLYRPCAVTFHGDYVAIAELAGRVVILDKNDKVVSVLGDNPNDKFRANFNVQPAQWTEGIFNAPHGLSYDNEGNLIIEEWNKWGRVTYLKRIPADEAPEAPTQ